MKRLWLGCLIFLWMILPLSAAAPVSAAQPLNVTEPQINYRFGEVLLIESRLLEDSRPPDLSIFWQVRGEARVNQSPVSLNPEGEIAYQHDLAQTPLPVFVTIDFWFGGTLPNGQAATSKKFDFIYTDNRFEWQSIETETFRIHWYQGDLAYAQDALNAAQAGLQRIQGFIHTDTTIPIEIYAYASAREVQTALNLSGQSLTAGHANPQWGIVLAALPPGNEQRLEMERLIPHELLHILLYRNLGERYNRLPVWLHEGLASMAELRPNAEYSVILQTAYAQDGLIPFANLCNTFPRDAAGVVLAYAQSDSFIRFIASQYGSSKLETLLQYYADGLTCERAPIAVFGANLTQLESQWQQTLFNANPWQTALQNHLPWLVLLALLLLTPLLNFLRPR